MAFYVRRFTTDSHFDILLAINSMLVTVNDNFDGHLFYI